MRDLFTKFIQATTAMLISCIGVYGILSVQKVCCGTGVDDCLSVSSRITVSYAIASDDEISPSQYGSNQPHSDLNRCSSTNGTFSSRAMYMSGVGKNFTCCETKRCNRYFQAAHFSLISYQNHYPLQKVPSPFYVIRGVQTSVELNNLSTALKSVPIYILTESIIC